MRNVILGLAAAALLAAPATAADDIPAEALKPLQAATVLVKVKGGGGAGFLLWAENETGLIVASHAAVAAGQKEIAKDAKVTVVFNPGVKGERSFPAEVAAADADHDLVFLKVKKVVDLPDPIAPSSRAQPVAKMTVFAASFPLVKGMPKENAAAEVSKNTVARVPPDDTVEKTVFLRTELPAGAPVVDDKGQLVGVAATMPGQRGAVVSAGSLEQLLLGRCGPVAVVALKNGKGKAELTVKAPLIDPLGKVKRVELYYVLADKLGTRTRPGGNTPPWQALPQAETLLLRIDKGEADGKLELKAPNKRLEYLLQAAAANADNKTVYTKPLSYFLDPAGGPNDKPDGVRVIGEPSITALKLPTQHVPPCMCWARDGKTFFHLDADNGTLRRVETQQFKAEKTLEVGRKCSWLAMSKEGPVLTVSDSQEAWLLDETSLEVKHKFKLGGLQWTAAAPGSSVAVGANAEGTVLAVFDLATGKVGQQVTGKSLGNMGVVEWQNPTMTPDGKYLFTAGDVGGLYRWKLADGELKLDESSQRILKSELVAIWATDDYVCAACRSGNWSPLPDHPLLSRHGSYVYPTNSFKKPAFTVIQGEQAGAIGFDAKAKLIYGHDHDHMLIFDARGRHLKNVKLGLGEPAQFLVHPDGYRVVVLTSATVYVVDLPRD